MATGINSSRSIMRRQRHLYRLEFFADQNGDGKVVELFSPDLNEALALIGKDRSRRVVDVWEDGTRVCRVSHGPRGLDVANKCSGLKNGALRH